jgi:putative endonuclease
VQINKILYEFLLCLSAGEQKPGALVGVTNDIQRRVWEHKSKQNPGFTSKYNINRLVYLEETADINAAIEREKEIKAWRRDKKVALIEEDNPK